MQQNMTVVQNMMETMMAQQNQTHQAIMAQMQAFSSSSTAAEHSKGEGKVIAKDFKVEVFRGDEGDWERFAHVFRTTVRQMNPSIGKLMAEVERVSQDIDEESQTPKELEQASAGLDALTDAERTQFTTLNAAYVEKYGFPFIIAVRDHNKASILAAFERRITNDRDTEFTEACRQVERIAEFRLRDLLLS